MDVIRSNGLLDALKEDINDTITWQALYDYAQDNHLIPNWYVVRDGSIAGRANLLRMVFESSAPTSQGRFACGYVGFYTSYAEPGYTNPASGLIAVGNWNACDEYDNEKKARVKIDDSPERLGELLGLLGVETEWSDEWTDCEECHGLIRTEPDGWHWQPSYHAGDGWILCEECYRKNPPQTDEEMGG